ncbi:MAG: Spy/CpxP family protein refolding chaperone [Xanthobacteraceae bacterium]
MLKRVVTATAVLAIAGSSIVYAQQRFGGNDFGHWRHRAAHHHRFSPTDMAAFTDARIAALKAGLELTPDQQKNWPAFEQALRDFAQLRVQRIEARQARVRGQTAQQQNQTAQSGQGQHDPFNRLDQRADNMAKTSAALKKVADAGAPLYQSLTDAQKVRFKVLSRMLRPHRRARLAFNDRRGGWRHGGRDMNRGSGGFEHHRMSPDGADGGGSGSQL